MGSLDEYFSIFRHGRGRFYFHNQIDARLAYFVATGAETDLVLLEVTRNELDVAWNLVFNDNLFFIAAFQKLNRKLLNNASRIRVLKRIF